MGRFSVRWSGDSEVQRIRRNVIALLTLSVGAAILLAFVFRLNVPGTALSLILGGVAPPGLYLTYRQTVGSESADEVQADDGLTLTETVLTRLAATVEEQWGKEYGVRTYNDPAQQYRDIKASWSAAGAPLAVPWGALVDLARGAGAYEGMRPLSWALSPEGLTGLDEGDLREILEKVPTGWLVVLGESGSGKTMLMLRTVREIINHGKDPKDLKKRKSGDPVPLFVPMTSWNPRRERLRDWLEKQLPIDYPGLGARVTVGGKKTTVIAMLLDEQKIMPVLDGLDELPAAAQVKAISRLNEAFMAAARPLRLVVTCRTKDYRKAVGKPTASRDAHPVLAAAAIELNVLDPDKVSAYLAQRGENARWAKVTPELMRSGGVLATALNTPLYASLASEIYNPRGDVDRDDLREPGELAGFADVPSVHRHLLDEFIPAVYATEYENGKPHDNQAENEGEEGYEDEDEGEAEEKDESEAEEQERQLLPVEHWLMILADYLTNGRKKPTPSLEWWDLRGLAPRWLVPAVVGIVCGVASGVAAGTGTHVGVGIGVGFGTGMLIAIAIGLSAFDARRRWDRRRLTKKEFDSRYAKRRPGPGMTGGMIGAVIGGVAAGVAGKYHIGHQASLFSGVPEALGMALGAGATTNFFGGLVGVTIGAFAGGYLAAVGLGLPAGLVNGLGVGVAVALVIEQIGRHKPSRTTPHWEKGVGIVGGGVIGLAIGLIVWREAGVTYGIVFGALIAALAAAPFGLRHADEDLRFVPSPGHSLARDAKAFQLTAISAGLAAGAAGFLGGSMTSIFEVHAKANVGLVIGDGLGIGIAAGLVVGLTFGFYHAASPEFRIITWWLAIQGKAPWRFKRFLDQAYKRTVLRQSGATYQFRHMELQLRLAARYAGTEETLADSLPASASAEDDAAEDAELPAQSPALTATVKTPSPPGGSIRDAP